MMRRMTKNIGALGIVFILVLSTIGTFAPSAEGDHENPGERNVMLELFTATWCVGCPFADAASEHLKVDYGERVSLLQYHIWEDIETIRFDTPKTNSRADAYNAQNTNIPAMWIDGQDSVIGALSDNDAYSNYKSLIETRLSVESQLELEIASAELISGVINVKANLSAVNPVQVDSFNVRFVIYENGLISDTPKPNTVYNYVVRDIEVQSVSSSTLPTVLSQDFAFNSTWNFSRMGAVVFAQEGDNGEVLQSHSMSFGVEDVDNDGLPDEWEMLRLGTLLYSADDDPDGDYITNIEEYLNRTDPLKKEASNDLSAEQVWLILGVILIIIAVIIAVLAVRNRRQRRISENDYTAVDDSDEESSEDEVPEDDENEDM
jgi:hypothetical protein